jgi:hypothetical protein
MATNHVFSHFSWWYVVILSLLAIFVAVYRFAPEIVAQIAEQATNIAVLFGNLFAEIGRFLFQFASILWKIWGLLFALRWRAQFSIRYFFVSTTLGILFLGSFYLCGELLFTLLRGFKSELPELYARMDNSFASLLPGLHAWLARVHTPHIPEIPFKFEVALFVLAVLMFRHHWHEFWASRRREAVPPALEGLFLEFDKFRKSNPTPVEELFLEILFQKMKEVLDKKNKRDIHFSLMEEEEKPDPTTGKKQKTGILQITFLPENSPLDKTLRLPVGQGGAGKAYDKKVAIYIPSVRHSVGIDLDNEESVGLTYLPGPGRKRFRSILSVPVLTNSKEDPVAVISATSKKRNGFRPEDFQILRLTAAIISTLY